MNLVLLGAPGSGKGTQAELICSRLGFYHFSTGDFLRSYALKDTELGRRVKGLIEYGQLVPLGVIREIISDFFANDPPKNILFDGMPRSLDQARFLDEILLQYGKKIDVVIGIEIDDSIIIERIVNRRICTNCGSVYNLKGMAPKVKGICDKCGTKLTKRADDNEKVISNRLKVYKKETLPLVRYYKNVYFGIDGNSGKESIYEFIASKVNGQL